MRRAAFACGAATLLLVLGACAGVLARNASRSARLSLPSFAKHVEIGIAAGFGSLELDGTAAADLRAHAKELVDALEADDRTRLIGLPLTELRRWSLRGIDERLIKQEIGSNVANSLRNQLDLFFDLVARLAQ